MQEKGNGTNMSYPDAYSYDDISYLTYEDYGMTERYITRTLSPIFLCVGTLSNLFSLIILYRLSREVISTCLYLVMLSVMDLLVLYIRCGNDWLYSVANIDISNMLILNSPSICKVYPFVSSFVIHITRWLLVCVAVEGVIATKSPSKVHTQLTTSQAEAVMMLLTVLLICINIHFFWSFELTPVQEELGYSGIMCTFNRHGHQSSEVFQTIVWPIIDTLVTSALPTVIISVCVIIMIIQITRGHHRGDEVHQAWQDRYQMDPLALDQLKITFLVVCIFYLPATLPKAMLEIVIFLYEKDTSDKEFLDYITFTTHTNIADSICTNIGFAYHSLKFFIYLATSKRFRLEARKILECSSCKSKGTMKGRHLMKHTESMATEPLMSRDGCERSVTANSFTTI